MDSRNKHQITKNTNFMESLGHAWDGIVDLFTQERNFRKHTCAAIVAVLLGLFCHISLSNWAWLLLAIFFVIVMEAINTIVENVVNLVVGHHYNSIAKRIKDIAAGGVLLVSFFAVLIGCLIFVPILLSWI